MFSTSDDSRPTVGADRVSSAREASMSVLSMEARAKVASCLVDGVSIRATERITGAHRDTVMRFGVDEGGARR